ncbi:GRXC4, partial [Symbiodinium necroappetens]
MERALHIFLATNDLHKRAGWTSMTGHALDLAAINQLPGLKHHIRYVALDEYQMYFRLRYDFIVREKQWLPENPNEVDVEMVDALPDVHHLLIFTKDELGQPLQLVGSLRLGFTSILEHTLAGSRSMQQFLTTSDRLQLQKFFQQGDVLEVSRLCVTKDADAAERKDAMKTTQLLSVFSKMYCTPSPVFVLFQAFQRAIEVAHLHIFPANQSYMADLVPVESEKCSVLCTAFTAFDTTAMSDVDDDIKKRSTSRNAVQEGLSWKDIAWLMLSDIVGTSVLTLNGVAAKLGWVLTIAFIGGLFPVALYSSLLMSRTRGILSRMFGTDKTVGLGTMGEIAACVFDSQRAGQIVIIIVYGYTALGQASYMLVMGRALQMSLYDLPLCLPAAVLLTIVALVVPIFGVRKLSESVPLAFFNSLLIVAVIVLALYRAGTTTPPCPHTFYFDPGLSGMVVLGAATNVVYSYAGQWMYFELMDTMAAPEDFPKSFSIAGPFMLISYLAVACLGYGFGSGSGDLIAGMPHGPMLQAAAAMLFIHVLIVYLIKSVVLVHFLHGCWKPNQVDARGLRSYVQHGGLGVLLLLMGFVVSNMVPFFSQLLGIIGGLFAGPIGFLFPITFFLLARGREVLAGREEHESLPMELQASSEEVAMCGGDDDKEESTETSSFASYETELGGGRCRYLVIGFNSLPLWERTTIVGTVLFIVATMVFGVADEIFEVIEMWDRLGAPFQCHHLQPPFHIIPVASLILIRKEPRIAAFGSSSQNSAHMAASIDELINANDMVVFSSSSCPFCRQALSALRDAGYTPKVVEDFDRSALSAKCGSTSVPKVFVKQNFIGGCNDGGMGGTLPLLKNGKIKVLDAFDVGQYEAVLTFSPTPGDFGSWAPVQQLLNEGILEKNEGWSGLMADHVQEQAIRIEYSEPGSLNQGEFDLVKISSWNGNRIVTKSYGDCKVDYSATCIGTSVSLVLEDSGGTRSDTRPISKYRTTELHTSSFTFSHLLRDPDKEIELHLPINKRLVMHADGSTVTFRRIEPLPLEEQLKNPSQLRFFASVPRLASCLPEPGDHIFRSQRNTTSFSAEKCSACYNFLESSLKDMKQCSTAETTASLIRCKQFAARVKQENDGVQSTLRKSMEHRGNDLTMELAWQLGCQDLGCCPLDPDTAELLAAEATSLHAREKFGEAARARRHEEVGQLKQEGLAEHVLKDPDTRQRLETLMKMQ